jgi:hypothetical protein
LSWLMKIRVVCVTGNASTDWTGGTEVLRFDLVLEGIVCGLLVRRKGCDDALLVFRNGSEVNSECAKTAEARGQSFD